MIRERKLISANIRYKGAHCNIRQVFISPWMWCISVVSPLQTTFSYAFSSKRMSVFRFKFHRDLFVKMPYIGSGIDLLSKKATSHHLNQCWPGSDIYHICDFKKCFNSWWWKRVGVIQFNQICLFITKMTSTRFNFVYLLQKNQVHINTYKQINRNFAKENLKTFSVYLSVTRINPRPCSRLKFRICVIEKQWSWKFYPAVQNCTKYMLVYNKQIIQYHGLLNRNHSVCCHWLTQYSVIINIQQEKKSTCCHFAVCSRGT